MQDIIHELKRRRDAAHGGGGEKRVEAQHAGLAGNHVAGGVAGALG